jgi:hypothetical protein
MNAKLIETKATNSMNSSGPSDSRSPEYLAILTGPPSSRTDRWPVTIWPIPVTVSSIMPTLLSTA